MTRYYGPHLILDLNNCKSAALNSLEACFAFLNDLPEKIGMSKITQPYIFRYSGEIPEDNGITGVVIIAESHISIHTYPQKRFVFMDIFSCKPFNTEMATEYAIDFFEAETFVVNTVNRGEQFPA